MGRSARGRQDGFSLIEVCIAAGLLGTAIVALAALFTLSIGANLTARHRTYATILAQQKLEELRVAGGALGPAAGMDFLDASGRRVAGPPMGLAAYERQWWVEPLAAAPPGLMLLRVEVRPRAASAGAVRLVTAAGAAP